MILYFVAASRNADLHLHLQAGEALGKLFFAMDRLKYKRLWPRYIADMHALKTDHPDTWRELEEGNISVTKSTIPFVSIGADHACEQLNRLFKADAGLTGISNNANARQRFFLATPELSILTKDFKNQFHSTDEQAAKHHVLSSENKRQHKQLFSMRPLSLIHILRHSNIQRFGINKPFLNQTQYINLQHTLIVNSLGDFNPSLGERSEPVLS